MKNILVIGLGRFGRHTIKTLSERNHEIMAIDKSEERLEEILPYVTNAQIGDSTNSHFMKSLGIPSFDVCMVCIGDDFQSSLETTSLLKELGAKYVVARASRTVHEKFLKNNGADEVVYPEKQVAKWAAIRYSSDHVFEYIEMDDENAIFEISAPAKWVGHSVLQLDIRKKFGLNILAVKQNGNLMLNISPQYTFQSNENVIVLGKKQDVAKCFRL